MQLLLALAVFGLQDRQLSLRGSETVLISRSLTHWSGSVMHRA